MMKKGTPWEERFWTKVDRRGVDECWEWTAQRCANGYGRFAAIRGKTTLAARWAYMFHHGVDLNSKEFVCHSCDNPPCCNPAHLWLGDHKSNSADMARKGRASREPTGIGETHSCAKIKERDVHYIRASCLTNKHLATELGLTAAAIYNIRHRKTWRHV